jgi:DNA-directed RNA polymerase specialized sigma24 family protein
MFDMLSVDPLVDVERQKLYALGTERTKPSVAKMMSEPSVQKAEQKKDWKLTSRAFHRFLDWLDEGTNSEGQRYLEMRWRLVAYFDRKNCFGAEELADETLNRVARRLEEAGAIESDAPAKYCYITARFVFMEYLRETKKETLVLDGIRRQPRSNNPVVSEVDNGKEARETMLNCLDRCTGKLESSNREIIVCYYIGEERMKIENRRALAKELRITMNALSIRACRIRDKLEACVRQCIATE